MPRLRDDSPSEAASSVGEVRLLIPLLQHDPADDECMMSGISGGVDTMKAEVVETIELPANMVTITAADMSTMWRLLQYLKISDGLTHGVLVVISRQSILKEKGRDEY